MVNAELVVKRLLEVFRVNFSWDDWNGAKRWNTQGRLLERLEIASFLE
jgi:hypothetical protein